MTIYSFTVSGSFFKKPVAAGGAAGSYDFTISPAVGGKSTWNVAADGTLTLATGGTYTIVSAVNKSFNTKLWGAGGGYGSGAAPNNVAGGAGGYANGVLSLVSGNTYVLVVGGAGANNGTDFGGGGGGGYSGIFNTTQTQGNARVIAGGGGGGGRNAVAGAGGGSSGESSPGAGPVGNLTYSTATGGTQVAGGVGGGSGGGGANGSALQGAEYGPTGFTAAAGSPGGGGRGATGDSNGYGSGGGGGGYYGGGAGGASGSVGGTGGGGGSGYIGGVTSGVTTAGTNTTPGNSADSDRGIAGGVASPGKIVISAYNPIYTFSTPSGGTLWGTLQNVSGSTTESFTVSPSTGGTLTTTTLAGLSGGSWDTSRLESNWIDFGSKYWWWDGTAGSWTQSGTMSCGFFLVRTGAVSQYAALVANWVNNQERWYTGFSNGTDRIMAAEGGADYVLTQNQVYWVNITYDGGTGIKLYIDGNLVSTGVGRTGSASGYLSIANYYAAGNYRPGTGVLYVNNFKIYTGSTSLFSPS